MLSGILWEGLVCYVHCLIGFRDNLTHEEAIEDDSENSLFNECVLPRVLIQFQGILYLVCTFFLLHA